MVARDTTVAVACVLALLSVYATAQTVGIAGVTGRFSGLDTDLVGYDVAVEGTAVFRGEQGMRGPTGSCLEQVCRRAYSDVNVSLDGLPAVGDDLHYLLYLTRDQDGGTEHLRLAELQADGGVHTVSVNATGVDGRTWHAVAVVLAANAQPQGEPGPPIWTLDYGPLEGDSPPPVDLTDRDLLSVRTPSTFRVETDTVTFSLLQPSRYADLTRCVWWVQGPGAVGPQGTGPNASYRIADPSGYEGEFDLQGCSRVQETWRWDDDALADVDTVLVTYESGAGDRPRGWPLVQGRVTRTT